MTTVVLPDRWVQYARFGRFCAANRIDPGDAARLHYLAARAFRAGERETSVPGAGPAAERARKRLETFAASIGLTTYWPGLLPAFKRRGRTIYLAEVK